MAWHLASLDLKYNKKGGKSKMNRIDYLCIKRLQKRFHTLPLDKRWLIKKFGKEGERIYGILLNAIKEGVLKRIPSVYWDVVRIDDLR